MYRLDHEVVVFEVRSLRASGFLEADDRVFCEDAEVVGPGKIAGSSDRGPPGRTNKVSTSDADAHP
ncbi:hypothetical protein [Halorussus halobius]|uniref:hypothetical protein n=1 Tax=Halorussus halobius TaxID=1710537 RepID=UPI00109217AF|nr:hypothetical protein [Halorussus halobius]